MTRWKRPVFALVTVVLVFGAVEAALWIAGVEPLTTRRDPFRGFSERVPVFELDEQARLWRTPPRATAHSFHYGQFLAAKPANGYRLFVLGGSSAQGFPWGGEAAFTRLLGAGLAASRSERAIEAVNAAAMSYGSHRMRILAHELARHEPDLVIVYEGHNEFVERSFYDRILARRQTLDPLRELLFRSRLYSALTMLHEAGTEGGRAGAAAGEAATTGELLGLDVDRQYTTDLARAERVEVRERFEDNLRAIVRIARAAGAEVILCTVASNLKDWPPNQSRFSDEVPFEPRQLVLQRLAAARAALAAGAPGQALELLEQATAADETYAATRYELGRALESVGRFDEARAAYTAARDLDSQPSRAPSEHNETIRLVARSEGAHLVDVERLFEAASEHGLVGFDLIEDYVHPKPEAHRLIARELWRTIEAEGLVGLPREPVMAAFDSAIGRLGTVDAARREANPAFLFNIAVVLEKQGHNEQAMDKYRACLALDPRFHGARFNLGRALFHEGRFAEAAEEQRRLLELDPDNVRAMVALADSLRRLDRPQEAERVVRRALELEPFSHDAWGSLGGVLSQRGDLRGAEQAFRKAAELDPQDAGARVDLGLALLFQGQVKEAEQELDTALALRPDDLRARNGIAAVYTEQGRLDDAERLFRENLAVDPTNVFARGGLLNVEKRRRASGRPS